MPLVWSDAQSLHSPEAEVWVGVRTPAAEVPERTERIRRTLTEAGAEVVAATAHGDDELLSVHDRELVEYLAGAWQAWNGPASTAIRGRTASSPTSSPSPGSSPTRPAAVPVAASARAGRFAYDTMSAIGPGSWNAIRGAVDCALTAADLALAAAPAAYACCRPPGHHARRGCFGGSCYLNNAAAAAARLRAALGDPVAILDLDAHHGNGTQRSSMSAPRSSRSVHVDPAAGWFPHFLGFDDESGAGAGEGATRNLPSRGDRRRAWLDGVGALVGGLAAGAPALVVALGVDAAFGDPESPLDGDRRRLPRGRRGAARRRCRRSSSRRAATTSTRCAAGRWRP